MSNDEKVRLMQMGVVSVSMSNIASVAQWAEKSYPELHKVLAPILEAEILFGSLMRETFGKAAQ